MNYSFSEAEYRHAMGRHKTRAVALSSAAAVLLSWTGLASAQPASSAWYGVELPRGLSDPTKPVISFDTPISELPYVAVTSSDPQGPENADSLNGNKLHGYLKEIIDFSFRSMRSGELLWGRQPGMPEYRAAVEWAKRQFEDAGLQNVQLQDSQPTELWFPVSSKVTLHGADIFGQGSRDVVLQSAFPQINQNDASRVPQAPVTAPMIFLGNGGAADLAGKNVQGRIAVVQMANPVSLYHAGLYVKMQSLIDAGAAGVIVIYDSPGNQHYYQGRGNWFCSNAPCYAIGGEDGYFLKSVMDKAAEKGALDQLRVTLHVQSERRRVVAPNVIGFLPGKSDKYIVVNAHADGHFAAAGDNGDGFATLIGLARYFGKKAQSDRKYNIVFAAVHGHHSKLNGPAEFVKANPDIIRNSLIFLNIEHTAQINMARGYVGEKNNFGQIWEISRTPLVKGIGVNNMAPAIVDLWAKTIERFGVNTAQNINNSIPGDLGGYRSTGKTLTQIITAGTLYHSSGDVIESISVPELERAARAHAWFIEKLDTLPEDAILPKNL